MSARKRSRRYDGSRNRIVYSTNTVVARRQTTARAGIARVAAGTHTEGGAR